MWQLVHRVALYFYSRIELFEGLKDLFAVEMLIVYTCIRLWCFYVLFALVLASACSFKRIRL